MPLPQSHWAFVDVARKVRMELMLKSKLFNVRKFPPTVTDATSLFQQSSAAGCELDGYATSIEARTESSPGRNAVPESAWCWLFGLICAGRPAISSQTCSCAHERPALGTVELPGNDGHSWVAWGPFARVLSISYLVSISI
jgi:hypothetical protein